MNLLTLLSKSSFLVSLVCLDKYLKLLLRPTELLQKRDLDILDAYNMMEDVIKVFYFFLQSIIKGIESLAQTQIFKPLKPDVVNL